MDEYALALIPGKSKVLNRGVEKYPIIIENPKRSDDGIDPKEMARRDGLWVISGDIIEGLRTPAPDTASIIAPSYMDFAIEQLKLNQEGGARKEECGWIEAMTGATYNYQFTNYNESKYYGKGKLEIVGCDLHLDSTLIESMSYAYVPLEQQGCDHSLIPAWLEAIQSEVWMVYQPGAYATKPTQRYMKRGTSNLLNLNARDQLEGLKTKGDIDVNGSYSIAKASRDTTKPITEIEKIALEWKNEKKNVRTDKLCFWLSELAKIVCRAEQLDDCKDVFTKFHSELNNHFVGNTSESDVIRSKTGAHNDQSVLASFSAITLIAACDTINSKVTWSTPYSCLRGALILAEYIMGDAYYYLRRFLTWSIRPRYYSGNKEYNLVKDEERNQYIYRRINLFDPTVEQGTLTFAWHQNFHRDGEKHINTGNVCSEYKYVEDDEELIHWYNDAKYVNVIEQLVNDQISLEEITHKTVFDDNVNTFEMNIEQDVYLDSEGKLITPAYINKKITIPFACVTLKCEGKVIDTEKKEEIWHKRISDMFLKGVEATCTLPMKNKLSSTFGLRGETLSKTQKGTDYFELLKKQYKRCTLTAIGKELIKVMSEIFSICKFYSKSETVSMHIKDLYDPALVDTWDAENFLSKMTNFSQLVIFLFDYVIEGRKRLVDEDEAKIMHDRIVEGDILGLFKDQFPSVFKIMMKKDELYVRDAVVVNLLNLACYLHRCIYRRHGSTYFMLHADEIKLLPIDNAHVTIGMIMSILRHHPGMARRGMLLNDVEKIIFRETSRLLIQSRPTGIDASIAIDRSREPMIKIYASSLCSGLGEILIVVRAVTYPKKGLIPVVFYGSNVPLEYAEREVSRIMKYSKNDIVGTTMIRIGETLMARSTGACVSKVMARHYMSMVHDLCIVKVNGFVLGNEELISKLMNRRRL
nr:OC1 protein [Tibet orbivirus]WFJ08451.1 VP2 [Tibet orbivirus]